MTNAHVLTPDRDEDTVTAEPTKWFFVDMLVRDVALVPAIADLVDNAVDAARKLRPGGDFLGLRIEVDASGESFRVSDNCGGLDLDVARDYAFRFGRDPQRPMQPGTIGQFGVGMKRTLFKIGQSFSVDAATVSNSFLLKVDVDRWLDSPVWAFKLNRKSEDDVRAEADTFTTIEVTRLYPDVAADMSSDDWLPGLAEELRNKHRQSIEAGLTLLVGGEPLRVQPLQIRSDAAVRPHRVAFDFPLDTGPVTAELVCGLAPADPDVSGWYVFCNGRMILGADTTAKSGWGRRLPGHQRVPRWHRQYDRFRGYLMLESDNSTNLPWNTTKTALDEDSPIWRACLARMAAATRGVIDFLNDYDRVAFGVAEVEDDDAREALERVMSQVDGAASLSLTTALAITPQVFSTPTLDLRALPEAQARISYRRRASEIDSVKDILGVTTNVEVGNRTFDYFIEAEGR